MLDYRDALKEGLRGPAFKAAWGEFELEYQVADLLVKLRTKAGLSQEKLAQRVGTTQSATACMESDKVCPGWRA